MIRWLLQGLARSYRKLVPMITLLVLIGLAIFTDFFSSAVREMVTKILEEYATKLVPMGISFLLALMLLNIAWIAYTPLCSGVETFLRRSHTNQRTKDLLVKLLKFAYWAGAIILILTLTAGELMSKFVLGFSVLGAALTLSLQGAASDFICGLLIQFCKKVEDGQNIELEGLNVKGKVLSVGYLSTVVDSEKAVIHVPNREIWGRAVKVAKPEKTTLILTCGCDKPNDR